MYYHFFDDLSSLIFSRGAHLYPSRPRITFPRSPPHHLAELSCFWTPLAGMMSSSAYETYVELRAHLWGNMESLGGGRLPIG